MDKVLMFNKKINWNEEKNEILKTIYATRKHTKIYLNKDKL